MFKTARDAARAAGRSGAKIAGEVAGGLLEESAKKAGKESGKEALKALLGSPQKPPPTDESVTPWEERPKKQQLDPQASAQKQRDRQLRKELGLSFKDKIPKKQRVKHPALPSV